MNKNFCPGCNVSEGLPPCALNKAPSNAYIENIINESQLSYTDHFICHKFAQSYDSGKLIISSKCDNCGLCYFLCSNINIDNPTITAKTEKVLLNDYGKASIFFAKLFSDSLVATEVQSSGNYRTKRVDLVIRSDRNVYLIKLLKTTDKTNYYLRSYNDVINHYSLEYPDYTFKAFCLLPSSVYKKCDEESVLDISALIKLIGGND